MFMMRYMYSVTPDILRVYFWGHINKNLYSFLECETP